jgi:hypothetical protein
MSDLQFPHEKRFVPTSFTDSTSTKKNHRAWTLCLIRWHGQDREKIIIKKKGQEVN